MYREEYPLRWSWPATNGHQTPSTGLKALPEFPIRNPGEKMSIPFRLSAPIM